MLVPLVAALAAGACGGKTAPAPYALAPGAQVAVTITVTERLLGTQSARRIEVLLRGAANASGGLDLDVTRARFETCAADGASSVADTDAIGGSAADQTAESRAFAPLLESLRNSRVTFDLDASKGLVAVRGVDASFAAAVSREPSLADARDELRSLASDGVWLRDLTAAGFDSVPRAVSEGGNCERRATVHVAGRGDTVLVLSGAAGKDTSGLAAVRAEGALSASAAFAGEPGVAPPDGVGEVALPGVRGVVTTSYASETSTPVLGEWTLTVPFSGGLSVTTTTSFRFVLR